MHDATADWAIQNAQTSYHDYEAAMSASNPAAFAIRPTVSSDRFLHVRRRVESFIFLLLQWQKRFWTREIHLHLISILQVVTRQRKPATNAAMSVSESREMNTLRRDVSRTSHNRDDGNHEAATEQGNSLPPTDRGRGAYLALACCTIAQAPIWGTGSTIAT